MTTSNNNRIDSLKQTLSGPSSEASGLPTIPQSGRADMARERGQGTFAVRQMTHFLDGGPAMTAMRERFMLEMEREPSFRVDDLADLTRAQIRERYARRLRAVAHWARSESRETFQNRLNNLVILDPGFLTRVGVHYGLFANTIINQGTDEQVDMWLRRGIMDFDGVIGCFAMTELGHGSNVPGMETTATFDRAADQFVLHTPNLTATKWWIGGAAESATHAIVYANMLIDGKSYGVKPFVVPLRDPKTFQTCPGVTIGDNGAKMGRNGIDNGWIQFTYVRIPRDLLLMRYTKVDRQGVVEEPPLAQLAYGALLYGRCMMIKENAYFAEKALMIAVRYAVVRRQFSLKGDNAGEMPLMDYQTHKYRLLIPLATAYAMHFTFRETYGLYQRLMQALEGAKADPAKLPQTVEDLKEAHGTCAGLKAHTGWLTMKIIEGCRQACGGHGYSAYSGLPSLYQDFVVQTTWEGDNTVLTLQCGRYLISCVRKAGEGLKLPEGVAYLNDLPHILKRTCSASEDITQQATLKLAFDVVCAHCAVRAARAYQDALKRASSEEEAFERSSIPRFQAARLHCVHYLMRAFMKAVEAAPSDLKPVLSQLCALYALHSLNTHSGLFLQCGYLQSKHLDIVGKRIMQLLEELRPQCIPLTDAFNLSDFMLNSVLGCYDGDIYRRYFDKTVQACPPDRPHPYFDKVLGPLLNRAKSGDDNSRN